MGEEYCVTGARETYCIFDSRASGADESAREVAVVLHGGAANVLWPLPENRYRWSFQVPEGKDAPLTSDTLKRLIAGLALVPGIAARDQLARHRGFEPRLVRRFAKRVARRRRGAPPKRSIQA
jgi:hypothetical protein